MILKLITPPAAEPVSIEEVEGQCRITDFSDELITIRVMIQAVRERAEAITRRALITQTHELVLDGFPQGRNAIELPKPPLQSVTYIKYTDTNGVEQTLDPLAYRVIESEPANITPIYGLNWPVTLNDKSVVKVRYVCGYGASNANVPAAIRQWCLLNVANLYEHRETVVVDNRAALVDLNATLADGLLASYRIHRL